MPPPESTNPRRHPGRAHLAAYKVPRAIVEVDSLPRSLIGKVLRREVRDSLLRRDAS